MLPLTSAVVFITLGVISPAHVFHPQDTEQVCVPPLPQARVAPGAQLPSHKQLPHGSAVQLPVVVLQLTVLVLVPQLPQDSVSAGLLAAGHSLASPVQASHAQAVEQAFGINRVSEHPQ